MNIRVLNGLMLFACPDGTSFQGRPLRMKWREVTLVKIRKVAVRKSGPALR